MHIDLIEKLVARRLRAVADEPDEAPYDWAEFQRRRDKRSSLSRVVVRNRPAVLALASAAVALVAGFAIARLSHHRELVSTSPVPAAQLYAGSRAGTSATRQSRLQISQALPQSQSQSQGQSQGQGQGEGQESARAVEVWLANLPRDGAITRVGEHAAVSSLQDQIAALDDLMSAERVAGAQPGRLGALERRRAQLVSSLAQLRYAEMLASAAP